MKQANYPVKLFIGLSLFFILSVAIAVYFSLYWIAALPFAFAFFYAGWQQWQVVFFLLIFSLPWSIEFNVTSSLSTDLPDEPLMLITAMFFLLNWIYAHKNISAETWKHTLLFLLLLHFVWVTISVAFSTDPSLSIKFWLAKGWYLLAFVFAPLILFQSKQNIRLTAIIFLYSIGILTAIIIYRHYLLGLSFEKINDAVSPFFRNHVNYSAMLACSVPMLIACYQLDKKNKLAILACLLLVLVAIGFSYSRGAWLAVGVAAATYVLLRYNKLFLTYCMAILFSCGAIFWLKTNDRYLEFAHDYKSTIFHKEFKEHWAATYQLKDVSTAERFNRWIAGVRMIGDRWLLGYGPNTFYDNYKPYSIPAFKTWVSKNKERSTVHNYFLFLAIEQGLPGLLIFVLLVGAMFFYAEKLYRRQQDKFYKYSAMAIAVIISMVMVVNFLSDLIESDKIGSLFFLCLSSLIAIDINSRKQKKQAGQY